MVGERRHVVRDGVMARTVLLHTPDRHIPVDDTIYVVQGKYTPGLHDLHSQ